MNVRRPLLCLGAISFLVYACSGDDTTATNTDGGTDATTDTGTVNPVDSSTGTDSSTSSDSGSDTSSSSDTSTGNDAACTPTTVAYAGCVEADAGGEAGVGNTFIDVGANDQIIDVGAAVTDKFTPRCLKIKAGQTVTWNGSFSDHTLNPAPCNPPPGDAGDSIPTVTSGTTAAHKFQTPGVYGYYCAFHGSPTGSSTEMDAVIVVY